MSIPILSGIIGFLSKGLDAILDWQKEDVRVELEKANIKLSEQQLEFLKEQLKIHLKMYTIDNANKIDTDFRSFVVSYEGSGDNVHPIVQVLRGIIRPLVTIWAVCIISWLMFGEPDNIQKVAYNLSLIPEKLWDIFWIIFGFWFGGRAVQHLIDKYSHGRIQEKREEKEGIIRQAEEETKRREIELFPEEEIHDSLPQDDFTEEELTKARIKKRGRTSRRGRR